MSIECKWFWCDNPLVPLCFLSFLGKEESHAASNKTGCKGELHRKRGGCSSGAISGCGSGSGSGSKKEGRGKKRRTQYVSDRLLLFNKNIIFIWVRRSVWMIGEQRSVASGAGTRVLYSRAYDINVMNDWFCIGIRRSHSMCNGFGRSQQWQLGRNLSSKRRLRSNLCRKDSIWCSWYSVPRPSLEDSKCLLYPGDPENSTLVVCDEW